MEYKYALLVYLEQMAIDDVPILFRTKVQELQPETEVLLDYVRKQKWAEIKSARDKAETSGCPFKGSVMDSDERSVTKINTVYNAVRTYGESFTIDWTMQDNSTMTLTYKDVLNMPLALAANSDYLHQKARNIREQIYSETDIGTIYAIEWE